MKGGWKREWMDDLPMCSREIRIGPGEERMRREAVPIFWINGKAWRAESVQV
jgi:hypothetical protein